MPIEGALRELGIHDVFQMLDLSRKTGALRVTSELRDNEGTVLFDHGRVVSASVRTNPAPLGTLLVRAGRVTEAELAEARARQGGPDRRRLGDILLSMGVLGSRELEHHVRLQIETVVFELMSWRDGFFSFQECDIDPTVLEAAVSVSTESLLMEGARRIDEWSRIGHKVPSLDVVPVLATVADDHATLLDLLPSEWEVLARIDGDTDLRGIATSLGRSEFDVAKVVYGLLTTGVVQLRDAGARNGSRSPGAADADPRRLLDTARAALAAGRLDDALTAARLAIGAEPGGIDARLTAARALRRLGRFGDAAEELRRAAEIAPEHPGIALELGFTALSKGDLDSTVASWKRYLGIAPSTAPEAQTVRDALASACHLRGLLEAVPVG